MEGDPWVAPTKVLSRFVGAGLKPAPYIAGTEFRQIGAHVMRSKTAAAGKVYEKHFADARLLRRAARKDGDCEEWTIRPITKVTETAAAW
jgi:hypothetical protein